MLDRWMVLAEEANTVNKTSTPDGDVNLWSHAVLAACAPDWQTALTTAPRSTHFTDLVARVQACQRCPRMAGRTRVLGPANGLEQSHILFIAEAPGRLGAERWHIPLYGDASGRNFEQLLHAAGLTRTDIFVSNAILCCPQDKAGRNSRPSTLEMHNCQLHLRATLDLLNPRVVVTLGRVALDATRLLLPHTIQLATDVGRYSPWNNRFLVPLYHPGPRACIRRPLAVQARDYEQLGRFVRRLLREEAPYASPPLA